MGRIFFALTVPEDVKENLERLKSRLTDNQEAVKWVEKHNLHLTLQFLGDIPDKLLRGVLDGAAQAAAVTGCFALEVRGVGVFPGPARPRVIWAGVGEGGREAGMLAAELSNRTGMLPDKPFSPHLTLGRVRQGRTICISEALAAEQGFFAGRVPVDSFVCLESTLTPRGPVYRQVARFLLRQH